MQQANIIQSIRWMAVMLTLVACGAPARHSSYVSPSMTAQEQTWEAAHQMERDGAVLKAVRSYRALCSEEPPYPRACYDECRALFDINQIEEGRHCAQNYIRQYSDSALAPAMGKRLASTYRNEKSFSAGAAAITTLAKDVEHTDVWDSLHFAAASLYRSNGDVEEEEKTLLRIVNRGRWGSQLWDNAIWRVIEIQRSKKDDVAEEKYIKKMLSAREDSRLIASYHSPYYDDALFRLGEIYLRRGNDARAYEMFDELSHWKTSRLRDDALVECAKIKYRSEKRTDACELLIKLLARMPESGSVRTAKKLMNEWQCSL